MTVKVIKDLFEQGQYQEVINQLAQLKIEGTFDTFTEQEQIECIYYQSYALGFGLRQWDEALQIVLAARKIYASPNDRSLLLVLLTQHIFILHKKTEIDQIDRCDETFEVITKGNAILESLTAKERETGAYWIALFEERRGIYYDFRKDWDAALECYQRALALRKEIGEPSAVRQSLYNIGMHYLDKRELDLALDYYQQALSMDKQEGNLEWTAGTLAEIGGIYDAKGDLDIALDYYQQALSISEKIGSAHRIADVLSRIGFLYWNRGELDTALEYYRRMLTIREESGMSEDIAGALFLIGIVYGNKGELNTALDYYQRSLAIWKTVGSDVGASYPLFAMIDLFLNQQDTTQAQEYLSQLQKLHERTPHETIYHQRQLAEALLLKQSKRMADQVQAQAILQQLLTEKNLFFVWTRFALFHLCELLLIEVKSFGDPEVWEEAKALIHQFYTQAQDRHSFSMIGQALLLRAKVATIDGDLQQALDYYEQARLMAEEKNLGGLSQKVDVEQERFEAEFEKWRALIQRNASLQERLTQSQLDDYIQQVQKLVTRMKD